MLYWRLEICTFWSLASWDDQCRDRRNTSPAALLSWTFSFFPRSRLLVRLCLVLCRLVSPLPSFQISLHVFHSNFFFKTADFFVARRPEATGGDTTNDLLFSGIKVAKIFMNSNLKLRTEEVGFLMLIWLFTTYSFVKSCKRLQSFKTKG